MEDKGVRFDPEDAEVLEGLARSLRAETAESSRPQHFGGWSAGTPTKYQPQPLRQSLRQPSPLKAHESAPAPAPSTPGSVFSLGSNAPLPTRTSTHRKITYLGPGMSMRRLNREPKPARKPLFDNLESAKKRKIESDAMEVEEAPTPEVAAAASVAAAFNAKRKSTGFPSRPPPAAREPRQPSPKKAGDDVLRDLIEETLGPETSKPSLVINPYEELAPAPSGKVPALRSSLRKSSSSLKVSMRGSASRGAAEKLANVGTSTRKMTTLEMVSGYKSTRDTSASASKSPEPPIPNPGSALKESTSVAPSPPVTAKPAFKVPEPATFSPLPVPSLSSSTMKSTPKTPMEEPAVTSKVAEITAPKSTPAPVFNPPAPNLVGLGPPPAVVPSSQPFSRPSSSRRIDPSAIYLSAKDSALNVDKAALPFFTFTLPSGSPEPSQAVKDAVLERPVQTFSFTVRKPSLPSSFLAPSAGGSVTSTEKDKAADKAPAAEWTCDTCMLKNPDSAKEQCTICEAPRPGSAPSKPSAPAALPTPPSGGFTFGKPATKAGQWTCDTCMLQNPDSAKEKCTVCEAPRPGAAPKAAAPQAALPTPPAGGFSFGAKPASSTGDKPASSTGFSFVPKPAAAGEWECTTCMLKNASTATEKCMVCEAPKPGAAPKAAAPPAALPTPPSGGFSFGAKPASTSTPSGFSFGAKPAATSQWTCDTCMLKNPDSAKEKCTVCEAPRPGAAAPPAAMPAPPSGGFSFGAKPAVAGEWECKTCMLKNPSTATEKCTVCEEPRPGAAPKAAAPPAALPAPPAGGFSFGGKPAGPPAPPSGGFSFGAKPAAPSSSGFSFGSSSASAPATAIPGLPTPPASGFTFGKPSTPAVAPLLKPTGGEGEWTCSTCGLKNPASATEQCTVCESPK